MIEKTFTLQSKFDGLNISGKVIEPNRNAKAIVQICHGMSEHRKRYYDFMRFLANEGFVCIVHDHRGHGESVKSKEDWGYFYEESGKAIVEDAYQVSCYIKEQYPDLPLYLFGHSMGSLVVRNYLHNHDEMIDKLIVCGSVSEQSIVSLAIPLVKVIQFFKGDHYRSPMLRMMVLGSNDKKFKEKEYNRWLSANMENVVEYNKMPDTGFMFTTNGYLNLFHMMRDTYRKELYQVKNKELSVLFVAGEDDPIIVSKDKWLASHEFLRKLGYHDVSCISYPGLRHEILKEKNADTVYQDILAFINK